VRLLLDTHVFLWWVADDRRLSPRAARAIAGPRNDVHVSAASVWEIVLKAATGALRLDGRPALLIPEQIEVNAFVPLAVTVAHALAASSLPEIHRDPFDRVLIAQAVTEGLRLVTGDQTIRSYPVESLW